MTEPESVYLTAPWELVSVRRGDALGLRAAADHFADLLAPGLTNATSDARWISLLSWCLKWSHVVWKNAGGSDLSRSDGQSARYAWLRPLELLWVDRTIESGQSTGQLRGRRSIERWRKADCQDSNFAMSPDQFRRYRQIGMYGAYRVVLRTIPGLTMGDGWTPGTAALRLARIVNESLPRDERLKEDDFEAGTKWSHWGCGEETRYWMERGWRNWRRSSARVPGYLPTPDNAVNKRLPEEERRLLESILFDAGSTRRLTAEVLAHATASSHTGLCDALANSSVLSKKLDPASVASLPAFSRLADAAMHTMRGLWYEINHDETRQALTVEDLARSKKLGSRCDVLRDASAAWLRAPGRNAFPHNLTVTRLAQSLYAAATPSDQLRALSWHHQELGGGRRWFRQHGGKLIPLVADTNIAASDYRFRLLSLSRLAAQCGVATMKRALDAVAQPAFDSDAGHEYEEEESDTI